MRFTPKTPAQIAATGLWQPCVCDYEITDAHEQTSNAGNDMIVLTARVFHDDGRIQQITDYLIPGTEFGDKKLAQCCEASNMMVEYDSGEIEAADFIGRSGKCKIKIEVDKKKEYPDKNAVASYLAPVATTPTSRPVPAPARQAPPARPAPRPQRPDTSSRTALDDSGDAPF